MTGGLRTASILGFLVAVGVAGALGAWVQARAPKGPLPVPLPLSHAAEGTRLESSLADLRRELDELRRERDALRAELARLRDPPPSAAPAPVPDPAPPTGEVERLSAAARAALERKDARAAMAAARELAALVPAGRTAAMGLLAEIADVREDLDVGDVAWGAFLGGPAVADLLAWSLGRPSPEAFREIAAEYLPGLIPPEVLVPRFREALRTEPDEDVLRSMVEGLIGFGSRESEAALRDLLADGEVAVPVRVQVATHLAGSESAEDRERLRAAAEGAPPALAAGIRAALSAADLPQAGFLVTGFVDGALRHGEIEVGDLLILYDGRSAADELNRAIRGALGRDRPVRVDLLRAGGRQSVEVAPGWLGLLGRVVRPGR